MYTLERQDPAGATALGEAGRAKHRGQGIPGEGRAGEGPSVLKGRNRGSWLFQAESGQAGGGEKVRTLC